jgi:hypothetical protein
MHYPTNNNAKWGNFSVKAQKEMPNAVALSAITGMKETRILGFCSLFCIDLALQLRTADVCVVVVGSTRRRFDAKQIARRPHSADAAVPLALPLRSRRLLRRL